MKIACLMALCMLSGCIKPDPRYKEEKDQIKAISTKISDKYPLRLIANDMGRIADDKFAPWGVSYISSSFYTLEEARPMVQKVIKTYICNLGNNSTFTFGLQLSKLLPEKAIAIKIAFWDIDVERPLFPFLAQIRYAEGKIYYYYADPSTSALGEPIVEELD